MLAQLVAEDLLVSDAPKGEVRIGFPIHAAGWFFQELYPVLSHNVLSWIAIVCKPGMNILHEPYGTTEEPCQHNLPRI